MERARYELMDRRVKYGIVLLGSKGDAGIRTVEFELPELSDSQLAYMKMDFPVPVKVPLKKDGDVWNWTVEAGATVRAGEFLAQLEIFCRDEMVWNSELFFVMVRESLDTNSEIEPVMLPELLAAEANLAEVNAKTEAILAAVDAEAERVEAETERENYIARLKNDVDAGRFKGEKGDTGEHGKSVTIESVILGMGSGAANTVIFSDGNRMTVQNGKDGARGPIGPVGPMGPDGAPGKDGVDRVEVPAQLFDIPVLVLEGDTTAMDKDNAVTLTYYYGDRTGTLTCKWQGTSSIYFPKKNYTIKFDTAFEAKAGWGTQKKYCLKANWVDASNIRNLLGAKIWGNMTKARDSADARLKALPNGGAVDGFPVWVKINGEDVGLYTWNIPKDAWMMGMTGANAGEAILCGDGCSLNLPLALDGELLKYDDGNPDNYQQIKIEYAASEDKSALVSSINNLISAVNNVQSENDLAALEAVLDIDSVIDYMILSGLMAHYDGTLKNWILATYDGVKWFMSAYDMDATFGNTWDGNGIRWANDYPFVSDIASLSLFSTVRTWYRNAIKNRWTGLSGWTMSETDLDWQVYNLAKDFPAELVSRDNRLWPTRPGTMTNTHEQIINWLRRRIGDLSWNIKDVL